MTRVSVLIPTYNRRQYLSDAIRSVLAQTHSDWEIVVVDDGSTDDTRSAVEVFGPSVRYFYQPNQGVSSARNLAFCRSAGFYVMFLDSDDTLLPNALADLAATLDANPDCDVAYSDGYVVDQTGNRLATLSDYAPRPFVDALEAFVVRSPLGLAGTMIRRGALERVDGPFDAQMMGYEDWDMFLRLRASGSSFCFSPAFTYCYRFHGGNKSAPKSSLAEKRRLSLARSRQRIVDADWFAGLPLTSREAFFEDFLGRTLKGDRPRQQEATSHRSFTGLPDTTRSGLLYRMTVNNILYDGARTDDRETLRTAARLAPTNVRTLALLALTLIGHGLPERFLARWRKAHAAPEPTDPVTRILRARNVA